MVSEEREHQWFVKIGMKLLYKWMRCSSNNSDGKRIKLSLYFWKATEWFCTTCSVNIKKYLSQNLLTCNTLPPEKYASAFQKI